MTRAVARSRQLSSRLLRSDHDALLRAHTLGAEHRRRSIEANRRVGRNAFGFAAVEAVWSAGEPTGAGPQAQLAWISGMQSDWDSIPIGA